MFAKIGTKEIEDFESKYNVTLSQDYKDYLLYQNGGIIKENGKPLFIKGLSETTRIDVMFGINTGHENANLNTWMDDYQDEMLENAVIIADSIHGGFIVLISYGKKSGVYYWDHCYHFENSNDECNTYFIADTFTAFIKSIT